jgi:hypothetical protein
VGHGTVDTKELADRYEERLDRVRWSNIWRILSNPPLEMKDDKMDNPAN